MALITPAKSHSEVVIAAVAARDRKRAEAYAKKHSIAKVHSSYQGMSSRLAADQWLYATHADMRQPRHPRRPNH